MANINVDTNSAALYRQVKKQIRKLVKRDGQKINIGKAAFGN